MADTFTFTDRVQAILASCTCLSCFPSSSSSDDPQNHPGTDADALSLHSNYTGPNGTRHLPRKGPKRISLFGWNLFGHGDNGVRLPDSDDEDGEHTSLFGRRHKKRTKRPGREPGLESSSTLDSDADAAPLDVSSIDIRAAEEAERRQREVEKAERRRLRRERKEMKRLALAAAFNDAGEFEGFPGSGSGLQPSPSPHLPPFTPTPRSDQRNEEEPDVDLDGGAYFGRMGSRNGDSRSNSDSRSQTSASRSTDGGQYAYRPHPMQLGSPEPLPLSSPKPPFSKKKRSKNSAQSSSSASASISLPSPAPDAHAFQPQIQGLDPIPAHDDDYESKFPSVGFTSAPRLQRVGSLRDQGAKLAQSGF